MEGTVFFSFRFYDRKILNEDFDLKHIVKNLLTYVLVARMSEKFGKRDNFFQVFFYIIAHFIHAI